jgi:glycosyltransferase involved in cell wall biosynthesis
MRILLLTHNVAGMGGSYQRAWGLARALAARGHDVRLIAARARVGLRSRLTSEGDLRIWEVPDVLPFRVRHGGLSPIDILGRIVGALQFAPDVIHSFDHRPACSLPAWAAARFRRTTWVADWADRWGRDGIAAERSTLARHTLGRWDDFVEKRIYRKAHAVTVASRELEQVMLRSGLESRRVEWVPPGCNADLIRLMPKAEARARYGLPQDAKVLVHIGFADYDEDLLAGVFVRLASRLPSIVLLTSGRVGGLLTETLRASGFYHRLRNVGVVPYGDLGTVMACGDVMLLPYRNRPLNLGRFPNKLADYLASGRPVVTNPTGDLAKLVIDEGFGLLADETSEAMADAVARLLEAPQVAEQMGQKARALAEGRLGWPALAARVEGLYGRLPRGQGASGLG